MSKINIPGEIPGEKPEVRRKIILNAAYECFLQYGFAKTSLDDIAKKAKLSRPLLYLLFKNKDDLFVATIREIYERHLNGAAPVLKLGASKKDKLVLMYEELLIKTWSRIIGAPNGKEFIKEYRHFFPHLDEEYKRDTLKLLMPIFEDRKTAELFMLCIEGLYSDYPPTAVLRRRVQLLADCFLKDK